MDCIETGIVQSVKNDYARVKVKRVHDCGGCKACIFAGKGDIDLLVRNTVSAKVGDLVTVDAAHSGGRSLLATVIGLGIPLILWIIGFVIGYETGLKDWINILVSFGVLAIGFAITAVVDKVFFRKKFGAKIVGLVAEENTEQMKADGEAEETDGSVPTAENESRS